MSLTITKRLAESERPDLPPGSPAKSFSPDKKRVRENPKSGAIRPLWPYFENFTVVSASPEALQLKAKTLKINQTRLPEAFIERICRMILRIHSGDLLHYKKKIPLADKSSYELSAFLSRVDNISYAFFSSGKLIDKGQKAKVSEGLLLQFEHEGSSIEPLSLQIAAKHILPILPGDTSASAAYKAHCLLGNSPHLAKIFFQGVYTGKHRQQLLSIMPRYTGSLGHYFLQQKGKIPLEAVRLIAASAGNALGVVSAAHLVHRDVKTNNYLAIWEGATLKQVVLSDWESCCSATDTESFKELAGTIPFFPPEMTAHHIDYPHYFLLLKLERDLSLYASSRDVWGYGVLLYLFLKREFPLLVLIQLDMRKATLEYEKELTSADPQVRFLANNAKVMQFNEEWGSTLFFLFDEEEKRKGLPADPSIEGFALRCLSLDPRNRPSMNEVKEFAANCHHLPERLQTPQPLPK